MISDSKSFVVGIDASNINQGGGMTHLVELLAALNLKKHNVSKVIVWSSEKVFLEIIDYPWLIKLSPVVLNCGLLKQYIWRKYTLASAAKEEGCDLLFIPGGSYTCSFNPVVVMSRNMLPFKWNELLRYKISWATARLILLRWIQSNSLRKADGIIFLTNYAKKEINKVVGDISGLESVIPHGLNNRFFYTVKKQYPITSYNLSKPYRMVYVSGIHPYKHQWNVVDAVSNLRSQGLPLVLDLVGPAYPASLLQLKNKISMLDPSQKWTIYHGELPYSRIDEIYSKANLGIFASSCENMPNILLETMAAGLPIACSDCGPMPEILGDDGVYFNPESPSDIASALLKFIDSPDLRYRKACASSKKSTEYSWDFCSSSTFSFFEEVIRNGSRTSRW